jgi:hypothetical protein
MNDAFNGKGPGPVKGLIQVLIRSIALVLGIFFMIIGLPLLISPFPVGAVLLIVGALLLASSSRRIHRFISNYLERHPGLWKRVKPLFDKIKRD